jgi:hypothetical protein
MTRTGTAQPSTGRNLLGHYGLPGTQHEIRNHPLRALKPFSLATDQAPQPSGVRTQELLDEGGTSDEDT